MNKLSCITIGLAGLLSVAAFAETKIAIIDAQGAMINSNAGKARNDKFIKSSEVIMLKAKIEGIQAEIKALDAAAAKESSTWSVEKKEDTQKKYQSLMQDYQFNGKKFQAAQQETMQQLAQELTPKYQAAVKQIIDAEKINILLPVESTLYETADVDITAKVIDAMNKLPDQPPASLAPALPAKK